MRKRVAVFGAGVLGRCLAFRWARAGADVSLYERRSETDFGASSFVAGGMLAPICELDHAPREIAVWGLQSIEILKSWLGELSFSEKWFQQKGSLVVAHPRDRADLLHLHKKIERAGFAGEVDVVAKGLFFKREAHVEPAHFLQALLDSFKNLGGQVFFNSEKVFSDCDHLDCHHDLIFDCRGLDAKADCRGLDAEAGGHGRLDWHGLRGVRGEIIELETDEVDLQHPVRLMHPRYPIYIIPRAKNRFVVGASVVESESMAAITARSVSELLSAAMTVEPAFAEARLVSTSVGLRPAFSDHLPRLERSGNVIRINGLYRHGFLLSPYIAEETVGVFMEENSNARSHFEWAKN